MTESVCFPLSVVAGSVVAGAFALRAALDRLPVPGVRRPPRRADRAIDGLNARLKLRIPAFHPAEKRRR